MAISTYGVSLKYGADSPTTEIIIKDFPSLLGKRNSLETTTLQDDAQTYIAHSAVSLENVKRALYKRSRPMRPTYSNQ